MINSPVAVLKCQQKATAEPAHMLKISTIQPALAPAPAGQLLKRRSRAVHIVNLLFPRREDFRYLDTFYSPVFLLYASTSIRRMLKKEWEAIKLLCAMDGITGRAGMVDHDLPQRRELRAPSDQVLPTRFDDAKILHRGVDFFRRHVERQFRPVDAERYLIDKMELFYLPAFVFADGFNKRFYAVDPLTHRVDPVRELPLMEEQVRTYLTNKGKH
ncbi:hypothetical protein SY88_15275 [Clostridiales bacterium PH28_bin88]|nr:hypothetical protein SY88_15275 [Clostridiales bacterium PH28_bin88]